MELVQNTVINNPIPDKNSKLHRQRLLTYFPSTSCHRFLEFPGITTNYNTKLNVLPTY